MGLREREQGVLNGSGWLNVDEIGVEIGRSLDYLSLDYLSLDYLWHELAFVCFWISSFCYFLPAYVFDKRGWALDRISLKDCF